MAKNCNRSFHYLRVALVKKKTQSVIKNSFYQTKSTGTDIESKHVGETCKRPGATIRVASPHTASIVTCISEEEIHYLRFCNFFCRYAKL